MDTEVERIPRVGTLTPTTPASDADDKGSGSTTTITAYYDGPSAGSEVVIGSQNVVMAGPGEIVGVCWGIAWPLSEVNGYDLLRMYVDGVKVGESDAVWEGLYTAAADVHAAKSFAYSHTVAAAGTYAVEFRYCNAYGSGYLTVRGFGVVGVALT